MSETGTETGTEVDPTETDLAEAVDVPTGAGDDPVGEPTVDDTGDEQSDTDGDTLAVPVAALRPSLEAILMVADQPLDQVTLASAVGYPVPEVRTALEGLAEEYTSQGRGFELRNVAGGWRFYTREDYAAVVEAFVLDGQQARLTQAALETLAVVAYKQPVSRARVSAVRGVNVDGVMRTLLTRGLVEEAGQDHETGANLYRTTSYFLERIGITSIEDLPELAPFLPDMDDLGDDLARLSGSGEAEVAGEPAGDEPADAEAADGGAPVDDDSAEAAVVGGPDAGAAPTEDEAPTGSVSTEDGARNPE